MAGFQESEQSADNLFRQTGRLKSAQITESSGVAFSSQVPNSIWTLNDRGMTSELFWVSLDGETIGELTAGEREERRLGSDVEIHDQFEALLADRGRR